MTLSGAPPPPLGLPPVAIVPYYLYTIVEISCMGNTATSQCAPAPDGGRAGARGVISVIKCEFPLNNKTIKKEQVFFSRQFPRRRMLGVERDHHGGF